MIKRHLAGYTLVEVMIVVIIIGVLAAIAYPSYRNYLVQSRRSDATIALTRAAAQQEKYFFDCGWYARTPNGTRACGTAAGNADTVLGIGGTSPEGHYAITMSAGNISGACASYACGFTAVATPVAGGLQVGDGSFRIDALGTKQWDKNNNGTFEATENTWSK